MKTVLWVFISGKTGVCIPPMSFEFQPCDFNEGLVDLSFSKKQKKTGNLHVISNLQSDFYLAGEWVRQNEDVILIFPIEIRGFSSLPH